MKKNKWMAALVCSAVVLAGSAVPASADGMRVVTLGADLSSEQMQTMMRYFKVSSDEVEILYITNQDERDHLSAYVPLEQIGTRTVSCAYVRPTQSGGIKVRTANLNWVTSNMIATTLSTSGVKNCEVIAACPFEVSGTGALTGIQMAYESASGEKLDETKKQIATEEMVVTGNFADEVGSDDATVVINQSKMEVIQNNVQNAEDIQNIVVNIAQQNNVNVSQEQLDKIVSLLEEIAQQQYNYEDMQETLERVDENVTGEVSSYSEDEPEDPESILNDVDTSALGEDVITDSTEQLEPTVDNQGSGENQESGGNTRDKSVFDEQRLYQYELVEKFCDGEYKNDLTKLQEAWEDTQVTPAVLLDEETGSRLAEKVESIYYDILTGVTVYAPADTDAYFSEDLNMMDQKLRELFKIDEYADVWFPEGEEDILADVSAEDCRTLYEETMKFFRKMYGEDYSEAAVPEENQENYDEGAGSYSEEGSGEESYSEESDNTDAAYGEEGSGEESWDGMTEYDEYGEW